MSQVSRNIPQPHRYETAKLPNGWKNYTKRPTESGKKSSAFQTTEIWLAVHYWDGSFDRKKLASRSNSPTSSDHKEPL